MCIHRYRWIVFMDTCHKVHYHSQLVKFKMHFGVRFASFAWFCSCTFITFVKQNFTRRIHCPSNGKSSVITWFWFNQKPVMPLNFGCTASVPAIRFGTFCSSNIMSSTMAISKWFIMSCERHLQKNKGFATCIRNMHSPISVNHYHHWLDRSASKRYPKKLEIWAAGNVVFITVWGDWNINQLE